MAEEQKALDDSEFYEEFAKWWDDEGQYVRAGGGDYERSFAFQAFRHLMPQIAALRAQLPSQGGEAVAWICTASRKDVSEFSSYWKSEDEACEWLAHYVGRGCKVTKTPLYTHPADQVADDLTMVKASRELLQDLRDLAFDQVEHHRAAMGAYKQARQSAMDSVLAQADALLRS